MIPPSMGPLQILLSYGVKVTKKHCNYCESFSYCIVYFLDKVDSKFHKVMYKVSNVAISRERMYARYFIVQNMTLKC